MRIKKTLGLALILLALASTTGLADSALPKGFGDWKKADIGEFMTVKIPGTFKVTSVPLTDEVRQKIDSMETYASDIPNAKGYICMVTYVTYNKGIMSDLDGAAAGSINNMKSQSSISNFKVAQKYIHRFKMKGIRLIGSFTEAGKSGSFQSEIFVKRNILWMVLVLDSTDKKLPAVTQAIFNSLQINAK